MVKVFVDTSVFIRFFTRDHEEKYKDCQKLFERIESGNIKPYVSQVVVMEIIFVLTRLYKFPKSKIRKAVEKLLQIRNITLIEKTNTPKALQLFNRYDIKYQDCLIATQIPKGATLITYDSEFAQIQGLSVSSPARVQ